jgi:hypothetical protein
VTTSESSRAATATAASAAAVESLLLLLNSPAAATAPLQLYSVLRNSVSTAAVWQLTPAGSTVTALREYKTLARLQDIHILPYLLNPAAVHAQHPEPQQPADKTLPEEVADGQFKQYLEAKFDKPQVEAILSCATHVQLRGSSSSSAGGGGRGSNDGSSGGWAPPVTLIQGPPGTGKTYTVLGVLNLWHMVLYHRWSGGSVQVHFDQTTFNLIKPLSF